MSYKVLAVEDDPTLLDVLKYNLKKEGYNVFTAVDGASAIDIARSVSPDLILLDIMLPKLDGLEVCRILRNEMNVPIIMLTAKSEEIDKVVGLEIGADDYITKPFSMREMLARVKAVLRRAEVVSRNTVPSTANSATPIKAGDFEIDVERHTITRAGRNLDLTPKEFDLLAYLASNKGRVLSRNMLLERVWDYDFYGDDRTVDVHIRWLRLKIEDDPTKPRHLITVRGVGYKFEE
ncbi:MAG: response regulator transcription factor [Chloroflexota bacterium]|nr:response regulator transcription factor [Chloroflexota bacterium]